MSSVTFPLKASANGRYWVDQNNVPFLIHGDSSWDLVHNCVSADVDTYLADRVSRRTTGREWNTIFCYYSAMSYPKGGNAPAVAQLGGIGAGSTALPFLLNTSGTTWDGDPNFTNHDAAYSSPNDAFFAWYLTFCQKAAAHNMLVCFFLNYQGTIHSVIGDDDGWALTTQNSVNTATVCTAFGNYLAMGHGTFAGFAGQSNILWIIGGDATPANGSTLATRELAMVTGLRNGGANQPLICHIHHDQLNTDQTDWSPSLTGWTSYAVGGQPVYAEARAIYGQTPTKPSFVLEASGIDGDGITFAKYRYQNWAAVLSTIGGVMGNGPYGSFWTSADGTTGGSPTFDVFTTAWEANKAYTIHYVISHGGHWYRCEVAGSSGSTGPTGTGSSISDGTITWKWIGAVSATMGGCANILGGPAVDQFSVHGAFFNSIPWWRLIPESLGGTGTIITSGQGTFGTWSDLNQISGAPGDWIVSASADDLSTMVCYVPHAHSGSFSVNMTRVGISATAYWIDPVSGAQTLIGPIASTGTHSFTTPGVNSGGDNDWVLLLNALPVTSHLLMAAWA